ncbi:MAG TPA: serine hydrolase [Sphingomicrobium sp.]|nr:serine hydrolase [Sphingomicrobium sp.]
MRRIAIIGALMPGLAGCAHMPAQEPRYAALDTILDTEMRELAMPGVSAAMMDHGRLVWTGARGWADAEKNIPVTPGTVFNIASLTKPMTAVVLMQLVERGLLSLDTPMQRYDPSFKDARITVRHVLTMTSEADPPGSSYSYNGNPYGKLNTVIKGITGEELAKAFSTRLIEPLGLEQTSPGSLAVAPHAQGLSAKRIAHYESINAHLARPHHMYGGVQPVMSIPPDPQPNAAANVVSTASDYARFADAVMRGRLLKPETLQVMWTTPATANGNRLPYAHGWFVVDYHGHRLINHYGYYPSAYSAVALIVPERELVFVALSNGGALSGHNGIAGIEGNAMACAVLVRFVDASLPCAPLAAANVAKWRATIVPPRHEMASDPAVLQQYAGLYERSWATPAKVFVDRGRLYWETTAGPFAMTQEATDRFFMKADDRTMVFVRDAAGRVTKVDITFPGDATVYSLPRM